MNEEIKRYLQPGKKNIVLVYGLYLAGLMFPIMSLLGAAFAYANQSDRNKIWQSHYLFALRTSYIYAVDFIFSLIKNWIFIGSVFYIIFFVWLVMRSIMALKFLFQDLPHPNPLTLGIK